jgi:Ca-activated chloride channel homolog
VQQLVRAGHLLHRIAVWRRDEPQPRKNDARRALETLSTETGGMAFFPKNIEQVDQIAAEVARDIRNQYTLGYHSTKPTPSRVFAAWRSGLKGKGKGKLNVRTRTGYFPSQPVARKPAGAALK